MQKNTRFFIDRIWPLSEVYRNSGLGKWFHGEKAKGTEPGWDRYNSKGERIGKCGDAKEGEAYAACLSRQKAQKLGKSKVGSFVRRREPHNVLRVMRKKAESLLRATDLYL